jgi:hypothetical protein
MPKARQKTQHLNVEQILEFLDSDDDDLPPVQVEDTSVPDPPYIHEEEIITEHAVGTVLLFVVRYRYLPLTCTISAPHTGSNGGTGRR